MSLVDRCQQFRREFPEAHINPTLLRRIYAMHKIKRRSLKWFKHPREIDLEKTGQELIKLFTWIVGLRRFGLSG